MYLVAETFDDLLRRTLERLLTRKEVIHSTKGDNVEILGATLRLTNPRARLSRTEQRGRFFSPLGELLWYLSGSKNLDFIKYYIPTDRYDDESADGITVYGAYGPRLISGDSSGQLRDVIKLLKRKLYTRQAVVQIFDKGDISFKNASVPCTCTMQFLVRSNGLNMHVNMRSNDAYLGLPHDVFCFTMIQELVARTLNVELGHYVHTANSLHLYQRNRASAEDYVAEGWQSSVAMPPMPTGDPWTSVSRILAIEQALRLGTRVPAMRSLLPYWQDIARLLKIFKHSKIPDTKKIAEVRRAIGSPVYSIYVDQRKRYAARQAEAATASQGSLFGDQGQAQTGLKAKKAKRRSSHAAKR